MTQPQHQYNFNLGGISMSQIPFLHSFQRISHLTTILLTSLTISSYPAAALDTFYISQNLSTESNQCQAALARARNGITKTEHRIVNVERRKHGYKDYPDNRYFGYYFAVEGKGNIFKSGAILIGISTDIVSNCKSVGLVSFGYGTTYDGASYGLMRNGKVEPFLCLFSDEDPIKWGYEECA